MRAAHIVVAGAGGNTGSHLLPHLARMSAVRELTLVDPDVYETKNVAVQNIDAGDVGESKVAAQAARLGRMRADLCVSALQARVEDIPRGRLRCDLLVSCVDSRSARQRVNEIAWRLGTPWIDCGVLGSQKLARMNTWMPGEDAPCLECGWDAGDYASLEQEYLCGGESEGGGFATMASSALGALAACVVAMEIGRMECGVWEGGRQAIYDAGHHAVQTSRERRRADCRFDHGVWTIEDWAVEPETTTIGEALREAGVLRIEGHRFVAGMVCPGCGCQENAALHLNRPLARCAKCNRRMAASGWGGPECLGPALHSRYLDLTLAEAGLRVGDIVSSGSRHRQIAQAA